MATWNSASDTGQRLFLPLGGGADNSKAPWWDVGGRIRNHFSGQQVPESQYTDQIMGAITPGMATNRTAPQVGMGNQFRTAQLGQLGQLQGLASGQQRTAGELAVQRQAQQAMAQQQAMARMARGGDAALAQRRSAEQTAAIGSNAAGQSQRAALEGQMAAHGMLTQAAGQGRSQDQQIQLANLDAQLKQMGMDDQARQFYLAQLTGLSQAEIQNKIAQQEANTKLMGAGIGAVGTVIGGLMSDERLKTDIADAGDEIDQMLDALVAKRYRYKDDKHGKGERAGIMAQHMEQSRAGKAVVIETPEGKGLDVNKAISAALASVARLNQRLRAVEAK